MRVLLLGRDGQVGRALRPALATLGEVVALGRAEADFERPGELARIVASHGPDVIVNAAAYTAVDKAEAEPDRARLVNTEAVAILAAAAQRSGAWLVHYSTDYVFDGGKGEPYVETDEPRPLSVYGTTKHRGDVAVAASGCRHLVFRVSWVYAAGRANFGATILRLARERAALDVVADQVGAPTSAALIAEVTAAALRRAMDGGGNGDTLSGVYHLAPSGSISRCDYARFIVAEARSRGARLNLAPEAISPVRSADFPTAATRPLNSRLATDKLRTTFGVALPSWQDGIRRWVEATLEEEAA